MTTGALPEEERHYAERKVDAAVRGRVWYRITPAGIVALRWASL